MQSTEIDDARRVVRQSNAEMLAKAFTTWAGEPASGTINRRAARLAVQALSRQDIVDFWFGCERGDLKLAAEAKFIRDRKADLQAALAAISAEGDRAEDSLRLSVYLAGVYIPAVGSLRQFDRALAMARQFLKRLRADHHRDVPGAGSAGRNPALRYALFGPVLMSLVVYHPQPTNT
jgi:hypothetical protein